MKPRLTAVEALDCLKEGNRRFVSGSGGKGRHGGPAKGADHNRQQRPIAIVLGCSDSRVPAELVFDQGFGDLFVIRVAGNIVAPSQIASVEFAASQFGTRLVIVMGHTQCGAVIATIDEMLKGSVVHTGNLRSIVDRVRPSLQGLVGENADPDDEALIEAAVRANIGASVRQLQSGSEVIRHLHENDGLKIVGAEYSLESGKVEFFED